MIVDFKCKETQKVFNGVVSTSLPRDIQNTARRKLFMLNAAVNESDLRQSPGNRLEKLIGNRGGQYSIRINDQWRICFEWIDGSPCNVEIADYHR